MLLEYMDRDLQIRLSNTVYIAKHILGYKYYVTW